MAARRGKHALSHLPGFKARQWFLYAIRLASGVVKIGATGAPRERLLALQANEGDLVERVHVHPVQAKTRFGLWQQEQEALKRAYLIARPSRGREWFSDLRFEEAVRVITGCPAPEPIAEGQV